MQLIQFIASQTQLPEPSIINTVELLNSDCTIPFISRYRKERTGNLDEVQIGEIVKLKELCDFEKGATGLAKAEPGEYPLVTTGAERKSCNTYQFDAKAVCIPLVSSTGHGHASLKNVHYQEGKFALGSILVALTSKDDRRLDIQFLHLYLSQLKDQVLVPLMSGAANVTLSVTKIQEIKIPLPPIEIQRELVEKFKSIVVEGKRSINPT